MRSAESAVDIAKRIWLKYRPFADRVVILGSRLAFRFWRELCHAPGENAAM
jgi:hypothetical protein